MKRPATTLNATLTLRDDEQALLGHHDFRWDCFQFSSENLRLVLRIALQYSADSLSLRHVHAASCVPTWHDEVFTLRLEAVCSLLGLNFEDHRIQGPQAEYSFRTAGKLLPWEPF